MNIAFDAVGILGPMSKNRGIGNYTLAQFQEMIAQDTENHYFFFNVFEPFSLGSFENLTEEFFDCGRDRSLVWMEDAALYGALVKRFIQKNKIDLFYFTSIFDSHVPHYRKEWFEGVQTVVTVYDIIPYVMKDHYFNGVVPSWYMECVDVLRWVDEMLVISQSVKDDLMEHLHFDGNNIEVIWGASGDIFQKISISEAEETGLRKKFGLKKRFIMCTGGDDERKNIAGLIEAYADLPETLKHEYDLAIVCKLQAVSVERYKKLAKKLGIREKLILTNFVTEEELVQLYNLATLVAFPSKYEGFGLPVVEAWACGTPVLTSNNSSLVQIAGDAAITVNPFEVKDITRGLCEALKPSVLQEMTEKGKQRLKQFRWPVVAKQVLEILKKRKNSIPTLDEMRPRLAYFTPLPPQESGIADYSVDVITELAPYFEIDVFIDDGYTPDCVLPESVHIFKHKQYPARSNRYFETLYQMGNSLFHYYMYPYLQQYSGTLVLHDYNMHSVGQAIGLHVRNDNMNTYREYLLEDYSLEVADQYLGHIRTGGQVDTGMELNGFVTNYATKIIVHSEYAKKKLLEKNIGRCVAQIPLYAKIEPLAQAFERKRKFGIAPEMTVFASFGHIHETKRALPLLKAGIRLLKENPDAMMLFVGKLDPNIEPEFKKQVEKSKVSERIRVTGYTSLEDFCNYIDASDVCFNLRYPYNGENSGSVARILAKGKAVVINDVGSFGEIPNECCVKLPPVETMSSAQEVDAIYQVMKELMTNVSIREGLQKKARQYAEDRLDIKKIAKQYVQVLLQKPWNEVTEESLERLQEQELMPKRYSKEEIYALSKTLAYCIE